MNPSVAPSVSQGGHQPAMAAGARTVRGQVLDSVAGTPVALARVTLFDEDEEQVALTISDTRGRFQLQAPEAGRFRLGVQAEFYEGRSHGPVTLTGEQGLALTGELNPLPVELRGLIVDAERRSPRLAMEGVYDRMAHGFGAYFDRERLDARPGRPVVHLIALLPMVEFFPDTLGLGEGILFRQEQFLSLRNPKGLAPRCFPQVYLDGVLFAPGGEFPSRLDRVFLDDMEAIEVYESRTYLPGRFDGVNAKCGTIVLWSRGEGGD